MRAVFAFSQNAASVWQCDHRQSKVVQIRTCITTNQPDTESNPNPIPNPAAKQHAVVSIQLNIVACRTYPGKFIRGNVVAPFVLFSIVIVTLPSTRYTTSISRSSLP